MTKYRIVSLLLAFVLVFQTLPLELSGAEGWNEVVSVEYKADTRHLVVFLADNMEMARLYALDGSCLNSLPEAPEKDGATFEGWFADGREFTEDTVIHADIQVTAVYSNSGILLSEQMEEAEIPYVSAAMESDLDADVISEYVEPVMTAISGDPIAVLSGENVEIGILDGSVPGMTEVNFEKYDEEKTEYLVSSYALAQEQEGLLVSGYSAFSVSMQDRTCPEDGLYNVKVNLDVDPESILPERTVKQDTQYEVFRLLESGTERIDASMQDGMLVFTTEQLGTFILRYTVEYVYEKAEVTLDLSGYAELGYSVPGIEYDFDLGRAAIYPVSFLENASSDEEDNPVYTLTLPEGMAWSMFDAAFLEEASVLTEGNGILYEDGQILLTESMEEASVLFEKDIDSIVFTISGFTKPERPVLPETRDFSFRMLSDSVEIKDILTENGIISPTFRITGLSDSNLVSVEGETLVAHNFFGEVVLSLALSDGTLIQIRLNHPGPVPAGEKVISEAGSFTAKTQVPAGTALSVKAAEPSEEEIAMVEQAVLETLGEAAQPVLWFDISLIGPDGEPIQTGAELVLNTDVELPQAPAGRNARVKEICVYHLKDGELEVIDDAECAVADGKICSISFSTEGFSTFAVSYTVDFHWEVDGRMYEFSLPGGGFISFSELMEVLGVAKTDENEENEAKNDDVQLPGEVPGIDNQDENGEKGTSVGAENAENQGNSDVYLAGEETGIENQDATALTLDGVVVSEDTWEFVRDVESVVFSSPDLVWVGKVDEESKVGGIKESIGLEAQYSAELTEEQIDRINGTVVESGDWALISVQPFESTESLTVTMKTGEVFEIRVTDAQLKKTVISASGETYEIIVTYDDSAEIPEGADLTVTEYAEDSKEYKEACEAVVSQKEQEDDSFDENTFGMSAFDISIIDSEEKIVEPKAPVSVTITIKVLPEEVVAGNLQESLEIQHLDTSEEDLVVDTVASVFEGNMEADEDTARAEFVLNSFSTFTVSWNSAGTNNSTTVLGWRYRENWGDPYTNRAFFTARYVDENGNGITRPNEVGYTINNDNFYDGAEYTVDISSTLGKNINNYTYKSAYITDSDGVKHTVTSVKAERHGDTSTITYYNDSEIVKSANYTGTDRHNFDADGLDLTIEYESNNHITVHYGYMEDGVFHEFDEQPYPTDTSTGYGWAYLIYDFNGTDGSGRDFTYDYSGTYYNTGEATDPTDGTEAEPLLRYYNGSWRYYASSNGRTGNALRNNGNWTSVSNDSHVYVVYERPSIPEGGTSKIDEVASTPDIPAILKQSDENGDGTNTLSLSVTGSQKDIVAEKLADVIVVLDLSSSMQKGISNNSSDSGYLTNPNSRYNQAKSALISFADILYKKNEDSGKDLIRMGLITFSGNAHVRQELTADEDTFDAAVNAITRYEGKGTNWEHGLKLANEMATDSDRMTFVVFITDGEPTSSQTRYGLTNSRLQNVIFNPGTTGGGVPQQYTQNSAHVISYDPMHFYLETGSFGTTNTGQPGIFTDNGVTLSGDYMYNHAAYDDVQSITEHNKNFYTIAISSEVGTDALSALLDAAGVPSDHGIPASTPKQLTDAFDEILDDIKLEGTRGWSDVRMSDGITDLTNTIDKVNQVEHRLYDVDGNFVYYKSTKPDGWSTWSADQKSAYLAGVEYAERDDTPDGYDDWTNEQKSAYALGKAVQFTEWTSREEDGCAEAVYNTVTGAVEWNMGSAFMLEDGVTYKVSFICWPSQEAYDIIAKLNNGTITFGDTDVYSQDIWDQFEGNATDGYTLKTNADGANTTYKTATKIDTVTTSGDPQTLLFGEVPNLNLSEQKIYIHKDWKNSLDNESEDSVNLGVIADGDEDDLYKTITVGANDDPDLDWRGDAFVSTGLLKVESGEMTLYESGHDFTITENVEGGPNYNWDLTTDTYRPMVITDPSKGYETTTVILKKVASTDEYDYQIGDAYYAIVTDSNNALNAVNHRRSHVEIVKNVEGDDAPENSRFTFTIEVTDSKADSGDINNTDSDAWVWFSIYDSDGQLVTTVSLDDINFVTANNLRYELINGDDKSVVDEVDETNIAYYSGYCCVPSGTTITAKLPSGYKLDVINLPVDSVCIITEPEDEIPAGYSIEGIVETRTYHDEEDEEQEEPIQTTNTNTITVTIGYNESTYKVDVNNQWDTVDVPVDKTWPDIDDDDSYTWTATFVLEEIEVHESGPDSSEANTTAFHAVDGVIPITISKGDSGDDIPFKNLPKYRYYDVEGEQSIYRIIYSVDETAYELKQNGTTVSKWDKTHGLTEGTEIYVPEWPHDAGDTDDEMHLSEDDELFYHVIVQNHKKDEKIIETLTGLELHKQWEDGAFDDVQEEDAFATFQLKRYVTREHLDYTSDYDGSDATVTLIGQDGNTDTLTVKKGARVNVVATFSGVGTVQYKNTTTNETFTMSRSWSGDDANKVSVAIPIAGDTTIEHDNQTGHQSGIVDEDHLVLDTGAGSETSEDTDFTNERHYYTLDLDGEWTQSIDHLPLYSEGSINETANGYSQTVYHYSYYFSEIDFHPSGFYSEFTDGHGNPVGDAAHRITEDDTTVLALNKKIPPFYVKKEWHDIEDPDNYPEVRFTLYQGLRNGDDVSEGSIFVGSNGESYVDIPLNSDNNWTWKCPGFLPTKNASGQDVGYYAVENTGNDNNHRQVLLYNNSELNEDGSIKVAGEEITTSQQTKDEVWLWNYYNDKNSNTAYRNDQQMPRGWDGGIGGNTGTLTIVNRSPKYMQMDIKKKIMEYQDDGSLATTTGWPSRTRDIVLKIQLMRRIYLADAPVDAEPLVKWTNYGVPFYVGYDSEGHDVALNDNDFDVGVGLSSWHWTILDQNQENGLPAYGYYTKPDGTVVKVHYRYIPFEIGAYSNTNEDPIDPQFDWFIGLQPNAWDGAHGQVPTFAPLVGQDQDRLMNVQASDLEVDKDWTETPDNVEEVYVKIYRQASGGAVEDFTNDIATRTNTLEVYGFVDDPARLTMLDNGALVLGLTPETGGVLIHSVLMTPATDNSNLNTHYYEYWIEEVGYKDKDGNVYLNSSGTSATSTFFPEYGKSDNQGNWIDSWTSTPTDNKLKLSTKCKNKLRVKNHPTKDIEVKKQWIDEDGNVLVEPWDKSGTTTPAATSISFKVKRSDGQYLTFGSSDTLTISTDGQRAVVRSASQDSTIYTVNYVADGVDEADIGNWTTLIHGLQKYASDGTEYTYTVEEVTNQNGKPVDSSGNVIENCHVTVTGSGANFVIRNEKVDTSLAIEKVFAGSVELTDAQKQKITFTVTGMFDGQTESSRIFTYGVDGITVNGGQQQTDIYKWNDGVLVIKDIQPGTYIVTEQNDNVDVIFEGDSSGNVYTHTRTYTVTAGTVNDDTSASATVSEGARTVVTITNTYDEGPSTIDVTLKKVDADEVDEEPNNLLQGATFTVTKYTDSNFNHVDQDTPYTQTKADVKDGNTYTLNGSFEFTDLPIGYYKVEESVMPTGYVKTGDDPVFEVRQKSGSAAELEIVLWKKTANGTGYEEVEGGSTGILRIPNNTNTIIVGNTPGAALPNTGGPGTRLFTILGSILILGAGVLLWRRRRLI